MRSRPLLSTLITTLHDIHTRLEGIYIMPGDCSSTFMPLRKGGLDRRHCFTTAEHTLSVQQKFLPPLLRLYSTFDLAVHHSDWLLIFHHLLFAI
jgi:hypothetical protein